MTHGVKTRKKKKRGSLSDVWDRIHEAMSSYRDKKIPRKDIDDKLAALNDEVNKSGIPLLIADNFVKPYMPVKNDIRVSFSCGTEENDDSWEDRLLKESNEVIVDPLGVYRLYSHVLESKNAELESDLDFEMRRKLSFHRELSKLPGSHFIFIAILGQISMVCQVFTAEKRGGKKITPGGLSMESYFPLLWALKQFEGFYKRIQNRDIRSDFGIIWHEGEWVEKTKNQDIKK